MTEIADLSTLRDHMGPISKLADRKVLPSLDKYCRAFIDLSPFVVVATANAEGRVDASPRGDPPGFVRVIDANHLLIPDRPGNNRVDTFGNLLSAAGIGLIFFVPGIDETLRVNGSAEIVTDEHSLIASEIDGKRPKTGLGVTVTEAFFHCGKALKRSHLWDATAHVDRKSFPTLGKILAEQIGGLTTAEADAGIDQSYRDRLY